jgi:hypothetical protein
MIDKEFNDGAVPSGNSVALLNSVRLARLTGRVDYEEKAAVLARTISANVGPSSTMFLVAASFLVGPTFEIVVVGNMDTKDTRTMLRRINAKFSPNKVVLFKPDGKKTLEKVAEYTEPMVTIGSKATVYICSNFKCGLPLTNPVKVLEKLNSA